jgi:hypothetical protein
LLGSRVRFLLETWIFVSFVLYFVGRGLCYGVVTSSVEFYQVYIGAYLCVCDLEPTPLKNEAA